MPAIAAPASSSASPAASALASPSSSSAGADPAQPGDFNSQFAAAVGPDSSTPAPAAPATPAPAPSAPAGKSKPAAADPGEGDPAPDDSAAAPPDPATLSAAVLEGMAALLASLAPPALPPVPTSAPDATSALEAPDAMASTAAPGSEGDAFTAPASPDAASLPGSSPALGSAASIPSPAALAALASVTASTLPENNATPLPATGNNLPSSTVAGPQSVPSTTDQTGQNQKKKSSDDSDSQKSPQNDPLASAFPAPTSVSGPLGTVFSDMSGMTSLMEKSAAPQAPAGDPAQAMVSAQVLDALAPAKVGTTVSVASLLRGYPIASPRDAREASSPAPAADGTAAPVLTAAQQHTPAGGAPESSFVLASNDQFADVIRKALDDRPMPTPSRIAVELQTPPGATVTVFFSQANGQLRAQLSASDSGSLHWLQQQVGNLRDGGGNASSVVWLPPQLDQQQGDNLSQQQRQQQEQPRQAAPPSAEDMAMAESIFGGMEAARN